MFHDALLAHYVACLPEHDLGLLLRAVGNTKWECPGEREQAGEGGGGKSGE